jgi:hypothetical protein
VGPIGEAILIISTLTPTLFSRFFRTSIRMHQFNVFIYSLNYFVPAYSFPRRSSPLVGQLSLIIEASRSHSDTPHSVGLLWTSDNTQHSQETAIHAPCGIRTCSPSKRAAVGPRLRPRDHWHQLPLYSQFILKGRIWKLSYLSVVYTYDCPGDPGDPLSYIISFE